MFKIGNRLKKVILSVIVFTLILFSTFMYLIISYPLSYQNLIKKYSNEFDIDPYLVAAIINVESRFDKEARSNKNAIGLMQITPVTGEWAAEVLPINDFTLDRLTDPEVNIMIGTWYLASLFKEFDNDIKLVMAAYNAGNGNVNKWLEDERYSEDGVTLKEIPFKETEEYIEKVQKNIKLYKILYREKFDEPSAYEENHFVVLMHNFKKVIKDLAMYK
ncbi:lytic transglycosylase domain-containing protein [Schnuerera sp. xch1]|uniref:lytic transglycosylase domain-containing protein n=1 Tax=Schnuerera sp. xch1 TaxID=2874283 RepID=UPI001CC0D59A|nr:lytic transglycosylase domain-containing protein [Schnuerera sp. xch1]MBZ2175327.1 lytic transglycosylase domain-containing protein [Schnuerera sp. xch1]